MIIHRVTTSMASTSLNGEHPVWKPRRAVGRQWFAIITAVAACRASGGDPAVMHRWDTMYDKAPWLRRASWLAISVSHYGEVSLLTHILTPPGLSTAGLTTSTRHSEPCCGSFRSRARRWCGGSSRCPYRQAAELFEKEFHVRMYFLQGRAASRL